MKVKELISELSKFDENLEVWTTVFRCTDKDLIFEGLVTKLTECLVIEEEPNPGLLDLYLCEKEDFDKCKKVLSLSAVSEKKYE